MENKNIEFNFHPFWVWLFVIISILLFITLDTKGSIINDSIQSKYIVQDIVINTELMNNRCEGFKDGYEDGYCYNKATCIPPIPPLCPMKRLNEPDTYKGGYQTGFKLGLRHQNN